MTKPHVKDIYVRSGEKSTPVLLKFQNGDLKNDNKQCTLYFPAKNTLDKSTNHAVVVTAGSIYSGPVSDGSKELVDTYLCVRNKTTNKVRILSIDQVKLINHVYEDKQKRQFHMLSKEDADRRVAQDFGGRKFLRYFNTQERNKVNIEVVQEQLENTVENTEIAEAEDQVVSTEDVVNRIRPKFNKLATNLPGVFSISDVIPLELLSRLDDEVGVLLNTKVEDIPISSDYLKQCITKLKTDQQSSQTLLKMKMIIYMDGLMKLLKSKVRNLQKLELSKITEKVENDIRERFAGENSMQKFRTSTTNEKGLCYFLVLAFLVSDEYELDLITLSTELCMSKARIVKYGNLVNASTKLHSNMLALRLPSKIKPIGSAFVSRKRKQ